MAFHSSSSSLLFIILFSFSFLNKTSGLKDSYSNTETHLHRLQISSLLPSSSCKSSKGKEQILEVFHRDGPCFESQNKVFDSKASLNQVLVHDQLRVEHIRARIASNTDANLDKFKGEKVDIPAKSGRSLGSGNYIVNVGLGTPAKRLSLIFDTASDLSWTQCQPCLRSCYQQQEPIFNPSLSSSYSNVSCGSSQCSQLSSATGNSPGCSSSRTCVYLLRYGDQSFTVGYMSSDTLTISTDEFPNFLFGCGQNNQGLFGSTAGLIGLGRDPLSLTSQTSRKYGNYFSYCLPSTTSSTGRLTLGKSNSSTNAQFTSFSSSRGRSFYFIDIIAMSIGGQSLPINQSVFQTSGSIIDSGTVITRLPPDAYNSLSSTFRQLMTRYQSAPAFSILDTCYDFGNKTTVTIPTISFTFSGNVKMNLAPSGILVAVSSTRACLAFAANNAANDVTIIGNTQQKTIEIVYDVSGGKLGFRPNGCN